MNQSPSGPGRNERLLDLLDRAIAAREDGADFDAKAACGDDLELLARLDSLLSEESGLFADAHTRRAPVLGRDDRDGLVLGGYRLVHSIGSGATGTVYEAERVADGQAAAVKVVRLEAGNDGTKRFDREARLAASIHHQNVVPVFDFGIESGLGWIAMRRLSGPSLDRLPRPLAVEEAARVGAAIARALDSAHRHGVVHRDVKPSNVLLDAGEPYLLDFGLARGAVDSRLTREGAVPGTLPYMPPEVLRGDVAADARSDVYALGATLYEAVAGRRAFSATDETLLVGAILLREPPPLGLTNEQRDFETIILRAMAKEPQRRFPTALALAEDFDRFRAGRSILSRRPGAATKFVRALKRRPRTFAGFAVAFLVTLALLARLGFDRRDHEASLRTAIRRIDEAIVARDVAAGRTVLMSVAPSDRDESRFRERLALLDGLAAVEDLLDQILDRWECQNQRVLARLIARVTAARVPDEARDRTDLALAVADLYRGVAADAVGRARIVAARRGDGPAIAAVIAAAETRLPEGEQSSVDAEQHLFAALAMRVVPGSLARRRLAIDRALACDPAHYRSQVALASLNLQVGDDAAAAAGFIAVARPGRLDPTVLRGRAWLDMVGGRREEALMRLDLVPEAFRSPMDDLIRCEIARRHEPAAEVEKRLAEALSRWPDDPELLILAADAAELKGDVSAARARLRAARSAAMLAEQRENVDGLLLVLELRELVPDGALDPVLGEADRDEALDIAAKAKALGEGALDGVAKARAFWLESWALRAAGRKDEAWTALDRSLVAHPWNPQPRIDYALLLGTALMPEDFPTRLFASNGFEASVDATTTSRAIRALAAARELLDGAAAGRRSLVASDDIDRVRVAIAVVARRLGDRATAAFVARGVLTAPRHAEGGGADVVAFYESLLAWAENQSR